jgi:hypothetical protein
MTALMWAARVSNGSAAHTLLNAGVNLATKNESGEVALDWADRETKGEDMFFLLQETTKYARDYGHEAVAKWARIAKWSVQMRSWSQDFLAFLESK